MRILKSSALIAVLVFAAAACSSDSGGDTTDATGAPVEGSPAAALETPLGGEASIPVVESISPASPAT